MHIIAPKPAERPFEMFFNVDAAVGHRGTASRVDVLLVQFMIRKIGPHVNKPALKARMTSVTLSGLNDDKTIDGIKAVQEHMRERMPGTIVDGRASPARGYRYGGGGWTIAVLNAGIKQHFSDVWPRLQDFPDCPGEVKEKVQDIL